MNKQKLESILNNSYAQGIHCFDSTATLHDYHKQSYNISGLPREMIFRILQKSFKVPRSGYEPLIHFLLHHSRTSFCRGLLALYLSKSCWYEQDVLKDRYLYQFSSENKRKYIKFKYDLSHLLIGVQSDAVSGLLVLASFFYRHNNYVASLTVINYALQKYTDEKIFDELTTSEITYIQKHQLNLMKKEKLYTVLKVLTIHRFELSSRSAIVPHELQLDFTINPNLPFHPLSFAYFLCFLCSYHLHDFKSCRIYLQQLEPSYKSFSLHANCPALSTPIMCGIANQLLGESNRAKQYFQIADMFDHFKMTSAALRLSRNF
ncbi:unnamed protein product [Mytilus edulis]|uniref:Uncharacterized protein n=1 Tax=Mytilus edulis TaxID=6550 RepID=A0A8S3T3X7_MYTED|nr:unnamed protein product [Mytilus edulis]